MKIDVSTDQSSPESAAPQVLTVIDSRPSDPRPFTTLIFKDSPVQALVDTGAEVSVISNKLSKQFKFPVTPTPKRLVGVNGAPL